MPGKLGSAKVSPEACQSFGRKLPFVRGRSGNYGNPAVLTDCFQKRRGGFFKAEDPGVEGRGIRPADVKNQTHQNPVNAGSGVLSGL